MISFVVPAYDEERLIGRTLGALRDAGAALGEPFEIVVADDASTDRTAAIAHEHGARVVSVHHRQIAATRNAGARAARGNLLVFVDADTIVNGAVVRAAVASMRTGAVGGGCGIEFDGRVPLYGKVLLRTLLPLYRVFGIAGGCFLFATRAAFDAVGGFDEQLFAAEELAMSRALHRQGRFVVLRKTVTTSGRRLRAHTARELLGTLARLGMSLPRGRNASVRSRGGAAAWYGKRRADPEG